MWGCFLLLVASSAALAVLLERGTTAGGCSEQSAEQNRLSGVDVDSEKGPTARVRRASSEFRKRISEALGKESPSQKQSPSASLDKVATKSRGVLDEFYTSFTALMQVNWWPDLPRAGSGKLLRMGFAFVSLIFVAAYTATLAAILNDGGSRRPATIHSWEDLTTGGGKVRDDSFFPDMRLRINFRQAGTAPEDGKLQMYVGTRPSEY